MRVRKCSIKEAEQRAGWGTGEDTRVFGSDLIDLATEPEARMTVGYGRALEGGLVAEAFPYDEVMVVLTGSMTVHTEDGEVLTVRTGETLYVPAGTWHRYEFGEDTELVYVAAPPSEYARNVAQHDRG